MIDAIKRAWARTVAPRPAPPRAAAAAEAPAAEAPPTMTDPAAQARLERWGFTVVPLFDAEALALVRAAHEHLGPAPDDPRIALNWSFHSQSHDHKATVHRLLDDIRPSLDATLAEQVVYLTTFITKWPGPNSGFPPHQDPTLVDERSHRGVTIWAPLHDTGVIDRRDNGMLHVVPGSHRLRTDLRSQDVDRTSFAGLEDLVVDRLGVGVPVAAGEAIVFDNRLLHHSMPNETDVARVVLSFGVRPAAGACVTVLEADDGALELYEVPDDFYIDVLPAAREAWTPPAPPLARLRPSAPVWTAEVLERATAAAGPAPGTVPARRRTAAASVDPGAFCSRCGGTDGLEDVGRGQRNNAQLFCAACQPEG